MLRRLRAYIAAALLAVVATTAAPSVVHRFGASIGPKPCGPGAKGTAIRPECAAAGAVGAKLQWLASTGYYVNSDSYDAASCYASAVSTTTGLPLSGGAKAILPFTLAGGAPTTGQTVWLASSQDDGPSNVATGAATATLPIRVTPAGNVYVKNIVPVGIVASAVNLGTAGAPKYSVTMASGIAPSRPAPPADTSFTVNREKFDAGGANNWTVPVATTTQVEVFSGESMCIKVQIDNVAQGSANVAIGLRVTDVPGGQPLGWFTYVGTNATGITFDPRGGGTDLGFATVAGLNTGCWTRYGGLIHVAWNGYPVQTTADTGATAGATASLRLDGSDGTSQLFVITKLTRTMNDAELLSVTGATYQAFLAAGANPYTPVLSTDPSCQWVFDGTTYSSGTPHALNCGTGTNFNFTVSGSPTVLSKTVAYNNSPAALVMASAPVVYDSDSYVAPRAFSYVGFTVATMAEWADTIVGTNNLDFDDADEEAGAVSVNGVPMVSIDANVGLSFSFRQRLIKGAAFSDPGSLYGQLGAGPYHVVYNIGEKIPRWGSFTSGPHLVSLGLPSTATMDSPTASKAMAFIDGSATTSGHGDDRLVSSAVSGAVVTRIRDDYTGIVVAPNVMTNTGAGGGLNYMGVFSSTGSVLPFVRLIYDSLQAVAAPGAVKSYVNFEGLGDWSAGTPLATFTTNYALALDTEHALDPTAIIIVLKSAQSNLYATSNGTNTLQQFVDAETAIAGARAGFVTLLDVTGPGAITWTTTGSAVGKAPTQTIPTPTTSGAFVLKANIKTRIHAAQPTVW